MLTLLHIENIAVIEQADISFDRGFNVLSGETGAGKSIIIDAISAILGERTYREVIRTGKPALHRLLRHPADRSMQTEIANVYPLRNLVGRVVGTARAYFLTPDTDAPMSRYGQIRSVATYVEAHYDEDITIPQLVKMTGMSETVFKQTFAKVFSMTPGHYLTTIRLNAVRRLLETTDKLLSEIAAETGFFDQSHLSRTFKRERGITPGEYRRKHRTISD